jgi:deferrochelatase/peroxidase EfeB
VIALQDLDLEPDLREHFGYRDGFSQPILKGSGMESIPGQEAPLEPGEFVLGYPDEEGEVAGASLPAALARNGSFLALRKLHQDVAAFRRFLQDNAAIAGGVEVLAAKMMGRWRGGAPLVLSPIKTIPILPATSPAPTTSITRTTRAVSSARAAPTSGAPIHGMPPTTASDTA